MSSNNNKPSSVYSTKPISYSIKAAYTIFLGTVIALSTLVIDFILQPFCPSIKSMPDVTTFISLAIGVCIATSRSVWLVGIWFIIMFLVHIVELNHICYFGIGIATNDIDKVFTELSEIWAVTSVEFGRLYIPTFALVFVYGLTILLWRRMLRHVYKNNYILIGFTIIFIVTRYISIKQEIWPQEIAKNYIATHRFSFINGMGAFSHYIHDKCTIAPEKTQVPKWKENAVQRHNGLTATNVVLIFGESCRYDHMSLFGYKRNTTPFLNSLKNDKNFTYRPAISSANTTFSALSMLINSVFEPLNFQGINNKKSNMLKLAKQNGYTTSLLSAQGENCSNQIGLEHMDSTQYVPNYSRKTNISSSDQWLVDNLQNLQLKDRNFIILQQRTPHSPYAHNYQGMPQFDVFKHDQNSSRKEVAINEYDNAILVYDDNIKQIFNFFKQKFAEMPGQHYLIFVGDHGEYLGENGLYGHGFSSTIFAASVPFWAYVFNNNDGKPEQFADIKKLETVSYRDINSWIMHKIGFHITNPNYQPGSLDGYIVPGLRSNIFTHYQRNQNGRIISEVQENNDVLFEDDNKYLCNDHQCYIHDTEIITDK